MKEVFEENKRCDEVLTVKEYLKIKTAGKLLNQYALVTTSTF